MSPRKLASATFQTLSTLPKSDYLGFKAHNLLNFALVQVSQQLPQAFGTFDEVVSEGQIPSKTA